MWHINLVKSAEPNYNKLPMFYTNSSNNLEIINKDFFLILRECISLLRVPSIIR